VARVEDLPAQDGHGLSVLPRQFFCRHALDVAPDLLGRVVEHDSPEGVVAVRLTEVEAYAGTADPGSHARMGPTARNATMFGPPGHLYVYFTYGMHWCANLVCSPDGEASAVLLRAGEVVSGPELARSRRPAARADRDLARGPARLASALGLTGDHGGGDVCAAGPVVVRHGRSPSPATLRTGPRVGVAGPGGDAAAYPWRFWVEGERCVSAYRAAAPRRRPAP
jgi:DNA-3-methyladenine glycosylase